MQREKLNQRASDAEREVQEGERLQGAGEVRRRSGNERRRDRCGAKMRQRRRQKEREMSLCER